MFDHVELSYMEQGAKNYHYDASQQHVVKGKSFLDETASTDDSVETPETDDCYDLEKGRSSSSWQNENPPTNPDYVDNDDDDDDDDDDNNNNNNKPSIPKPPATLVPVPIQHCQPSNALQRPAMQFPSSDNSGLLIAEKSSCGQQELADRRPPIQNGIRDILDLVRKGQAADNQDISVSRRLKDFERARSLRHDRYDESPPWGIFGLYYRLWGIRVDYKWAEHVTYRRSRQEPYTSWADYVKEHETNYHYRPWFMFIFIVICTIMMIYEMHLSNWRFVPLEVGSLRDWFLPSNVASTTNTTCV